MSSRVIDAHQHPVAEFYARFDARLDDVGEMGLMTMSPEELRSTLVTRNRARAKEDALYLGVLAQADDSGACLEHGAADAGGYVAKESRQTRRETRADLKLAKKLASMPILAGGMAARRGQHRPGPGDRGALDPPARGEHAVTTEQLAQAEAHLVDLAATYDAAELKALGRTLFEVVAPDVAEELLGKQLEAEEARAARRTSLVMWQDDQGTCHGRFRIPARHGQMLRKAIQALTNPVRPETTDRSPIDTDLPSPRPRTGSRSLR